MLPQHSVLVQIITSTTKANSSNSVGPLTPVMKLYGPGLMDGPFPGCGMATLGPSTLPLKLLLLSITLARRMGWLAVGTMSPVCNPAPRLDNWRMIKKSGAVPCCGEHGVQVSKYGDSRTVAN